MTPRQHLPLFKVLGGEGFDDGVWLLPYDGPGYCENIDGKLASQFEVSIGEADLLRTDEANFWEWRGRVTQVQHKYSGMDVHLTIWTGSLNADSVKLSINDETELIYGGKAATWGLQMPKLQRD